MDLQEALTEIDRLKATIAESGPKPCVVGLVTDLDGKRIALIRHKVRERWELPGGKLKPAETWQAALLRELQEEIGATVTLSDPCLIDVLNGPVVPGAEFTSVIMVGLGATGADLIPGSDATEARFFTADEIPWGEMSALTSLEIVERWAHEKLGHAMVVHKRNLELMRENRRANLVVLSMLLILENRRLRGAR